MLDDFNLLQFVRDHWPFLVVSVVLAISGEVAKRLIIPRGPSGLRGWRYVWYATLPLHAPCIGFVLGCMPFMPCPRAICTSWITRALYYAGSGVLSSYVFAAMKHIAKEKLGSDAPGASQVPPAPTGNV